MFRVYALILLALTAVAGILSSCMPDPNKQVVWIILPDPLDYADTNWAGGQVWSSNITAFTTLVWSDEFNSASGTVINTNNWVFDTGATGYGNNEWQNYTTGNYVFTNGNLVIKAYQIFNGWGGYTSTRIKTLGKQQFLYGTIAARIKLPTGKGIWPAFWMMGTNGQTWPRNGEIDIMEMIGNSNTNVYGNIFWDNGGSTGNNPGTVVTTNGQELKDAFHVFAIERTKTQIKWYFDNTNYMTRTMGANQDELTNQAFYILLNLAIGGNWPGYPDITSTFPQRMYVDWIRVYQ